MTHSSLFFHASFSLRMSKNDKNMIRKNELKKDHISTGSPRVLYGPLGPFAFGAVSGLGDAPCTVCALSPLPVPRRSVAGAAARRWRPRRLQRPQRPRAPSCSSPHSSEWLQMASDGFRWLQDQHGQIWSA